MKRMVAVLLLLALLAAGCAANEPQQENYPIAAVSACDPMSDYAVGLRAFYTDVRRNGEAAPVTLPDEIQVSFDGENYLYSDASGTRAYRYFLSRPYQHDGIVCECLMLSDDPDMTVENCKTPDDGMLLLRQTLELSPLENIGQAPKVISQLLQSRNNSWVFAGRSYFQFVAADPESLGSRYTLNRYGYDGTLISATELLYYPCSSYVWETPDGGFLLKYESFDQKDYSLRRYDSQGNERWGYSFPSGFRYHYTVDLFQRDGKIYLFGTRMTSSFQHAAYMCIFSDEGMLQKEVLLDENVDISYVQLQESGLLLYGTTGRTDGSFPFYAGDGPAAPFKAIFDLELSLQSAHPATGRFTAQQIGYYQGKPAYRFTGTQPDGAQIPAQLTRAQAVFDYEDGYVVYERYDHETPVLLQDPLQSTPRRYYQQVYTGYDAQGTLLWRCVSPVYYE